MNELVNLNVDKVMLRKGGKIKWNCKDNGHYLNDKKTGDWKREEGSKIEHGEGCSELDKLRSNYAFGKSINGDIMKHNRKGKKGKEHMSELEDHLEKFTKEMGTGIKKKKKSRSKDQDKKTKSNKNDKNKESDDEENEDI
jgi:hypothetical protein